MEHFRFPTGNARVILRVLTNTTLDKSLVKKTDLPYDTLLQCIGVMLAKIPTR